MAKATELRLQREEAPCKGCLDRTIEPRNCHDYCEKYKAFRGGIDKTNDARNRYYSGLRVSVDPDYEKARWTKSGRKTCGGNR